MAANQKLFRRSWNGCIGPIRLFLSFISSNLNRTLIGRPHSLVTVALEKVKNIKGEHHLNNRKKPIAPLLATVAFAGIMAGCGTTQASSPQKSSAPAAASSSSSSNGSSQQLVLYSAQGYDAAMAKEFQKVTGIKVKLVDDSTGNVVAKIQAEKANPHWDVAWFDGASTMQALDNQGLLLKGWTPSDVGNYTKLGQSLIPSDKSYYPTGVTAAATIGYNTKLLSASQAPKTWSDLLKPEFKNAIAMNDPSISGPTYPFVAGMLQMKGTSAGKSYFEKLKQNGLKVFPTNDVTLKALLTGQVKAVMIQDSALVGAKVKGDPIQLVYPASGVSSMSTNISIDKNAPDMAAAKKFVEFILTKQAQNFDLNPKNGGGDSYYNPVIQGVSPDSVRQQTGINWVPINAVSAAKQEAQIKKWFHDHITQ